MMDTTYWGWKFGVVVIKDHISGNVVWHKFIERKERIDDYAEGISFLKKEGYEIICVVSDGLKGLRGGCPATDFSIANFISSNR